MHDINICAVLYSLTALKQLIARSKTNTVVDLARIATPDIGKGFRYLITSTNGVPYGHGEEGKDGLATRDTLSLYDPLRTVSLLTKNGEL